MTVQTMIDANQCQSKSGFGARYNAVTHGLTAKTALLAGEDALALEAKIAQYRSSLQTRNAHEDDLATRAAEASWRLDRSTRAEIARYTRDMMLARKAEALEQQRQALALGQRLFFDRRGPAQLYPSGETYESRFYARDFAATKPPNAEAARAILLAIVDRATARLQALEAEHEEVARVLEKLQSDLIAFDHSKGGEQIQRLVGNCNRLMDRNIEAIYKGRRYEAQGWGGTKKERERRIAERANRLNVCGSVGPSDQSLVLDEEGKIRPAYGYAGDLEEGLARYKAEVGPQPYPLPESRPDIDENDITRVPDYARWKDPAAVDESSTAATMNITAQRDRAKIQNKADDFDTSWVFAASEAAYGPADAVIGEPSAADQNEGSENRCQADCETQNPHPAQDQVIQGATALSDGAQATEQAAVATMGLTAEGDRAKNQSKRIDRNWNEPGSPARREDGPAAKPPSKERRRETVEQWIMNRPLLLPPLRIVATGADQTHPMTKMTKMTKGRRSFTGRNSAAKAEKAIQ